MVSMTITSSVVTLKEISSKLGFLISFNFFM